MIDVHIPANLFYPELPGGSNQYFRYGPYLRDRGVRLNVHTILKQHHEESETEVRGIRIRRYEVPGNFGLLDELEFVTERAIDAIDADEGSSCLHPLGTTAMSPGLLKLLWGARLMKGVAPCFHYMMVPRRESSGFAGGMKESLRYRVHLSPWKTLLMCSHVMGRAFTEVAGVSPGRIEVIPNGIDFSVFSPVSPERKSELRAELGLPQDAPLVLYVGSVLARKGIEILIEAWKSVQKSHPEARLVIVGSTGARPTIRDSKAVSDVDQYQTRIFDQIDRLDNPGSVIFAGEVDHVQEFYRAADLFAFASLREGLPSVILESMACGTPCVTAPFLGLPDDGEEYGVDGEHFVKTSHDPQQMAEDIVALIKDENRRLEMGAKAVDWIRETQEMGMAADRLAAVYREIAT